MRPIPAKHKKIISEDPFFRKCCITGSEAVSIEHCWIYAGRQINEMWAYVPLRRDLNTSHPPVDVKEKCKLISLNRATDEDLAKYPRKNWEQIKKYLTEKYAKSQRETHVSEPDVQRAKDQDAEISRIRKRAVL